MSKVTKALKADLPALAELLRSKGKGKDTILAHINPREAELLKSRGGSGEINPDTGLPMFENEMDFSPAENVMYTPGEQAQPITPDTFQAFPLGNAQMGFFRRGLLRVRRQAGKIFPLRRRPF